MELSHVFSHVKLLMFRSPKGIVLKSKLSKLITFTRGIYVKLRLHQGKNKSKIFSLLYFGADSRKLNLLRYKSDFVVEIYVSRWQM